MKNSKNHFSHILIVILLFCCPATIVATEYFFHVHFTDKNNTPFSLSNPSEFLSARALERRMYFQISLDETDLPVNPEYLKQIKEQGFQIHNTSKWLNGATITCNDSARITQIEQLPFIQATKYTGKIIEDKSQTISILSKSSLSDSEEGNNYGYASTQIEQVNGTYLHKLGYKGKNIHIGVIDAGFSNVDIISAFNLTRLQNRLLGTRDFVNPQSNIYKENAHGANVFSIIAGNIEGEYIGTAPEASYWLVRTENDKSEYPMEMDFWVSAVEYLDSLGIDVINSSLGYTTFDNPALNLTHDDLNGKTVRMSRAAEIASKKGIVVVNSAGNDGNKAWKKIGAPADANGIITVGAVTSEGVASTFSSFGPTSDGRIKPEVSAMGTTTAYVNSKGVTTGNGTSYSAPVFTGIMACFLQLAKENLSYISLPDLSEIVFKSADQYDTPTDQLGYGIPNFEKAVSILAENFGETPTYSDNIYVYTDNLSKTLRIKFDDHSFTNAQMILHSLEGRIILNKTLYNPEEIISTGNLPVGIYAVHIILSNGKTRTIKVIIK
ncbi:hypothetical protein D0T49_03700 [Paludibacter sp. 221]|uniref:S8 family serine peptidase n=1 Tax=Paludibacter sp. 221 TaxID=2302939 RepID=UPI0013D3530B|nr:S8 family serine peptidase [Paludibacter sp. 221]NDV46145.1 hypothetical protein [Paludibacter sp. 221]